MFLTNIDIYLIWTLSKLCAYYTHTTVFSITLERFFKYETMLLLDGIPKAFLQNGHIVKENKPYSSAFA